MKKISEKKISYKDLRMNRVKQREEFIKKINDKPDSNQIIKHINNFSFKSTNEFIELTKNIANCSKKKEIESYIKRKNFYCRNLILNRENIFKNLLEEVKTCSL